MNTSQIGIVGGGSWATALAKVLNGNGHAVTWWLRNAEAVAFLKTNHHNPNYLSPVFFQGDLIHPTHILNEVIGKCQIIFLAVPSAFLKDVLQDCAPEDFKNKIVVSAIKGMIPGDNLIIAEYLEKYFHVPFENIVVISGPSHAEEVALEKLSYLTLACPELKSANRAGDLLHCEYVRCTSSDDIYGTEYSAVLKNIYAIAAGMFHGLGYGDNFQAVLVSNAIEEIERFVNAVHPIQRDIKDSAYLGDLVVTCYSHFSRNRTLGTLIGKGHSVEQALAEMKMIAEGFSASKCIYEVNKKYQVKLPLAEAVHRVLHQNYSVKKEMKSVDQQLS